MKIILLFSLFLTSLLASQTQIVLGTYSKHESAINIKSQIDAIIKKDTKLKDILKNTNAKSVLKEINKYYVVTIEPFNNYKIQNIVLGKIKKTKFRDAYVLKIDEKKRVQTKEEKQIPQTKTITTQNTTPILPISTEKFDNGNIVKQYFKEIISFILILTLSIIFLLVRKKNTHKKVEVEVDVLNEKISTNYSKSTDEIKENIDEKHDIKIIDDSLEPIVTPKKIKQFTDKKKDDFQDFKNSRIMLAEDNMINQKVVRGLLSTSGIQIVVVDDGLEAINFLKEDSDFCIILMDAHMPNMDGFEATRIIRQNENYSHITVIALSGDTAADDVKKMKEAGMQEHLEKPLNINSLYSILDAYSFKRKDIIGLNENLEIDDQRQLYTDIGIKICGDDEEFYKEILNDFINDYADSTTKIQDYLNNNQFLQADKLLLDISGVIANIGATNIKNLLKEFRVAVKNPEDKKYLQIFTKYAKYYEVLVKEAKEYLAK